MSDEPAFENWMGRLQRGDADAATEIFQRFARRLIGLARTRLDQLVRQKLDPEDVMQSVLKTFFRHHAQGEYDLANWDSLWSLLTVITLRKCGYQTRHFRAACRDVQREVAPPEGDDEAASCWQALAREPTPAEAALLADTIAQLFRGLKETERQMLERILQGCSLKEISEQVGHSERTAYRFLERIKGKLERMRSGTTAER